jgi:hypothetical protein
MIGDWLETMVDRKGFEAQVYPRSPTTFEIAGNNAAAMTALLAGADAKKHWPVVQRGVAATNWMHAKGTASTAPSSAFGTFSPS